MRRYVAQLALYRAVLARIYPEKTVRAALIFTNGPALIEVPAAAMDAAMSRDLQSPKEGLSRSGEGALTPKGAGS